jgi:hypothetical protein
VLFSLLFRQNNRATRKKYNIMQQIDVLKTSKISVFQIKRILPESFSLEIVWQNTENVQNVPGTRYPAPATRHPLPGTRYPYPLPGTHTRVFHHVVNE